MPTTPPTVAAIGETTAPWQYAAVDEVHDIVEHPALLSRRDGVVSENTKFTPDTVKSLLVSVNATFATVDRVLITGAGVRSTNRLAQNQSIFPTRKQRIPSKVNADNAVPTKAAATVATMLESAGVPELLCRQNKLVTDIHDAVPQPFSAICTVTVESTV